MKKILLSMLGAIVALTSCQKDDLSSSGDGSEVAVSIAASLPTTMTRSSEQGGIDNVDWTKYSLRYTLEIYDGGELLPIATDDARTQRVLYKDSKDGAKNAIFETIRLLSGRDYQFVIWADFVTRTGNAGSYTYSDLHYVTANGLTAITPTGAARVGNDDSRDAYFVTETVKVTASVAKALTLKRPFGKLRIITTDVADIHTAMDAQTTAKVTYNTSMASGFNAFDGTVSADATVPAEYTATIVELSDTEATLSCDYLFVPATTVATPVQVPVQFKVECLGATFEMKTDAVKLERNKLTTVKGKLLTKNADISVIIDDEFDTPAIDVEEVATIDDVQKKLNDKSADGLPIAIRSSQSVSESKAVKIPAVMVAATTPKVELEFTGGIASGKTLTIEDETPAEGTVVPYTGEVYVSVPASEAASLVVNMPAATVYINGKMQTLNATVSPNTLIINSNANIGTLTINAGNVIIYGTVANITKAEGYKGSIIRGIASSCDMARAANDVTTGYEYMLVEKAEGIIDGKGAEFSKRLIVSANVEMKNFTINNASKLPAFKIAGSNLDVKLSGVTLNQSVEGRGVEINDSYSNISFAIYNSNIIIPNAKQYGVMVINASDIRVTLDGTHIAPQKDRMGDCQTDYTAEQINELKKRTDARCLAVANSKNVTVNINNNSVLEGAMYALYTQNSDFTTINIDKSTLDGRAALEIGNTYKEAIMDNKSVYNITNSKLIGRNYFGGPTEDYATIVFYNTDSRISENNYVYLKDSEIYCFNNPQTPTNWQYAADMRPNKFNLLSFDNVSITDHSKRLDYVVKIENDTNEFKAKNVVITGKEGVALLKPVTE